MILELYGRKLLVFLLLLDEYHMNTATRPTLRAYAFRTRYVAKRSNTRSWVLINITLAEFRGVKEQHSKKFITDSMGPQPPLHGNDVICPCRIHLRRDYPYCGILQVGKLADLVLWKPSLFGAKPEMVVKGGAAAWAQMGDPNASIPTPEPVEMRPMFAGKEGTLAAASCSVAFVSAGSLGEGGAVEGYGLKKR